MVRSARRRFRAVSAMFRKLLQSFQSPAPPSTVAASASRDEQARALIAEGNALEDAGRVQEAHAQYLRALQLAPQLPAAHLNLGIAQEALGDAAAARVSYERVLAIEPGHPFGAYNLAKLEYLVGHAREAESLLQQAIARKPDFVQAWILRSNLRDQQGDATGALQAIEQALRLQPEHAGALFNRGALLRKLGRIDEAEASVAQAAALDPDPNHLALHNELLLAQGFADHALVPLRAAIAAAPARADLRSRELFILNLVEGVDVREVYARHEALGRELEQAVAPLPPAPGRNDGRLRLGFVSEDFRVHPVALFLLPLLERLDRARFEVVLYSSTRQADHVTPRLRALADRWVDAAGWPDRQLSEVVAADGVDLLVDLGGHTGVPRLGVFAAQPARVQLAWVGYLNTSGLRRMHFRITDDRCDPPQLSQPLHTERLLAMPQSQWCYRPFLTVPVAPEAPCERTGQVTFGSLNSVAKLTPEMAARWGRILAAVPGARLLVADVTSQRKREAILAAITAAGGAAGQVEFVPRTDLEGYYRLMDRIDIALDSHPYGGGTTTFDALWMGVPVLAAAGALPAARSAASLLSLLDLPEWIAPRIEDYEAVAIARAADRAAIAQLRRGLRERLQRSPLMDEARFAADFQALLERAWAEAGPGAAA